MENMFFAELLKHEKNHQTAPHQHQQGQIYLLNAGMIRLKAAHLHFAITPHRVGWLPPMCEHEAVAWGKVSGWSLYLPASLCSRLPRDVCVLETNTLIEALIERVGTYPETLKFSDRQNKIVDVLLDELCLAKSDSLILPLPQDPRLLKITQALLADLASIYSQVEWAAFAGLSVRTLSRHFLDETGMSFSRWKTLARVIASLEKLSTGESVANVAFSLGYENPSTYIAVFKEIMGVTPGAYFSHS